MDVVPSELITGRWKLNSRVCTIMCFGHIDSAAACFNEHLSHCRVSLIPLSQTASNVTNVHSFFFFFFVFLIWPDSDGRLPGDSDRCGDPRANCRMCVPRLGPQGH